MTVADAKAAARKEAFARRKAAHKALADADTTATLRTLLVSHHGKVIAGYMPIYSEIDPRPAMAEIAGHATVVLPVIDGKGLPLSFRVWTPGCKLEVGAFGAKIPVEGATLEPDVLIVPMVAFDDDLYRLGYGGGFYDRTLEKLRSKGPVTAIGFAYGAQQTGTLPRDATDQPLDVLATESNVRFA